VSTIAHLPAAACTTSAPGSKSPLGRGGGATHHALGVLPVFPVVSVRLCVRPVGWPHNLQASRGQGPSPVRARTTRRTAKLLACCVRRAPGDGQAAHGRPGQQRPIRPLAASLASSCPISSPWPAAAGGGSGRMGRPSARRPSSCDQCGSTAATEPRRGRAGALVDGNGRRAGRSRARRAGAGAIRRLPRCAAPRHTSSIGTQHVRPYRVAHGCAGGWPASGDNEGALC